MNQESQDINLRLARVRHDQMQSSVKEGEIETES